MASTTEKPKLRPGRKRHPVVLRCSVPEPIVFSPAAKQTMARLLAQHFLAAAGWKP